MRSYLSLVLAAMVAAGLLLSAGCGEQKQQQPTSSSPVLEAAEYKPTEVPPEPVTSELRHQVAASEPPSFSIRDGDRGALGTVGVIVCLVFFFWARSALSKGQIWMAFLLAVVSIAGAVTVWGVGGMTCDDLRPGVIALLLGMFWGATKVTTWTYDDRLNWAPCIVGGLFAISREALPTPLQDIADLIGLSTPAWWVVEAFVLSFLNKWWDSPWAQARFWSPIGLSAAVWLLLAMFS